MNTMNTLKNMSVREARESILKDAPTEKVGLLVSLAFTAYYNIDSDYVNDINTRNRVMAIARCDDGYDLTDFRISDITAAVSYVNSIGGEVLVKYIYMMFGATAMIIHEYPHMYD